MHPRGIASQGAGPYSASACEEAPSSLALSFFLANERDEPVAEGDRLQVGGQVIYPRGDRLADPDDPSQSIFVDLLTLDSGDGNPVSLLATIDQVVWRPLPTTAPARLVLLEDHSRQAGDRDSTDQRLAALSELVGESLCHDSNGATCTMAESTQLSLYKLFDDRADPLLQRTRDYEGLQNALDLLRKSGEQGDAPHFALPGGGDGGIPKALTECNGSAKDTTCSPVVVLMAGEVDELQATTLDSELFPDGTRVFVAGLSDSPSLRRLACQTGGFFDLVSDPADLRLLTNRSTTDIPEYSYGFARRALLATRGRWEVHLTLSGVPTGLDMSQTHLLAGSLVVTLGNQPDRQHTALAEFQVTIGGY